MSTFTTFFLDPLSIRLYEKLFSDNSMDKRKEMAEIFKHWKSLKKVDIILSVIWTEKSALSNFSYHRKNVAYHIQQSFLQPIFSALKNYVKELIHQYSFYKQRLTK